MKRICLMLLLVLISVRVYAADIQYVADLAGLLTQDEIQKLSEKAASLSEENSSDFVIVTTNDNEGKTSEAYADDYYDYNGYGYGSDKTGALMLIDMDARMVWISTCGGAISRITDAEIDTITAQVAPYLTQKEYYNAADSFLDLITYYYTYNASEYSSSGGEPQKELPSGYSQQVQPYVRGSDSSDMPMPVTTRLLYASIGGAVIAGIVVLAMYSYGNRSNKMASGATTYLVGDSFNLKRKVDRYTHTTQTRTKIEDNNNHSGGGGSSTHTSSSGTSHGGGGRGF